MNRQGPVAMTEAEILARMQARAEGLPFRVTLTSPEQRDLFGRELDQAMGTVQRAQSGVGRLNQRNPGILNDLIQFGKRLTQRALSWYTRTLHEFGVAVSNALQSHTIALKHLAYSLERTGRSVEEVSAQTRDNILQFEQRCESISNKTQRDLLQLNARLEQELQALRSAAEAQTQELQQLKREIDQLAQPQLVISSRTGRRFLTSSGGELHTEGRVRSAMDPSPIEFAGCTIIAKNYLSMARVLAESWHKFHPDAPFFVLLLDSPVGYFSPESEDFKTVLVTELGIPNLPGFLFKYSILEASTAVKPFFLSHLFHVLFDQQASVSRSRHSNPALARLAQRPTRRCQRPFDAAPDQSFAARRLQSFRSLDSAGRHVQPRLPGIAKRRCQPRSCSPGGAKSCITNVWWRWTAASSSISAG